MKPFIPWVGGKTALRPVLYRLFPSRLKRYVEVFGGSGALLFGREPRKGLTEIYNDYNSDLVNLFACVRDRPLDLLDELGYFPLNSREEFEALRQFLRQRKPETPYLREELELCQKRFPPREAEELTEILMDRAGRWDVKRAAAYYKVIKYSYGAGGSSFGGQPVGIQRGLYATQKCDVGDGKCFDGDHPMGREHDPSAGRYGEGGIQGKDHRCEGCPYPHVGFTCRDRDGSCLRTDVEQFTERQKKSWYLLSSRWHSWRKTMAGRERRSWLCLQQPHRTYHRCGNPSQQEVDHSAWKDSDGLR